MSPRDLILRYSPLVPRRWLEHAAAGMADQINRAAALQEAIDASRATCQALYEQLGCSVKARRGQSKIGLIVEIDPETVRTMRGRMAVVQQASVQMANEIEAAAGPARQ